MKLRWNRTEIYTDWDLYGGRVLVAWIVGPDFTEWRLLSVPARWEFPEGMTDIDEKKSYVEAQYLLMR